MAFLFFGTMSFLFLSASMAALFGLQNLRMLGFVLLFVSLCLAAILSRPSFNGRYLQFPLLLAWLLALMAVADMGGTFDPLDFKVIFPVMALLVAPNLAYGLRNIDVPRVFWWLLTFYIVFTFMAILLGSSLVETRGYGPFIRVDPSGSIVTHSSLCLIYLILSASFLSGERRGYVRVSLMACSLMAVYMLLGTATRTPIFTLTLFTGLLLWSRHSWERDFLKLLAASILVVAIFAVYTIFISDAFWLRIITVDQNDYSSGRAHSVRYWLELAASKPLGIGAGGVRELLADGRPYINGTDLLEWPHNEFVRFYVESGPLGLIFLGIFVGYLVHRSVSSAAVDTYLPRSCLILIIAADLMAQSVFQNYFNTIYHATILIMILAVLSVHVEEEIETEQALNADPVRPTG